MKKNLKLIGFTFLVSVVFSLVTIWSYDTFVRSERGKDVARIGSLPVNYANYLGDLKKEGAGPVDFSFAAKASVDAVVHIKTKTKEKVVDNNNNNRRGGGRRSNPYGGSPFEDFFKFFDFDDQPSKRVVPETRASGSGVIISEDGYIVTNYHVISDADEIKITLSNKKSYQAKVVGKDAGSDLAVLKIEGKGFPYLAYGNSEEVQIGQWVLAVGYPLFLDVTVTAGIVSAKSRSIGINNQQSNMAVEAFIQTDAAVNRGNSGGALVNTQGELIGINSAIASPTGYYSGYSYAIPANMVKKVVRDIVKYGSVQRAFLGISYPRDGQDEIPENLAKKYPDYKQGSGVFVMEVAKDGAAAKAGLQSGDVIVKINEASIVRGAQLVEQIAKYYPGDKIKVTYVRKNKVQTVEVQLQSNAGTYGVLKFAKLGAEFETLSKKKCEEYRVKGGVWIKRIGKGLLQQQTRIRSGFIITKIEGKEVSNVEQLQNIITGAEGYIQLEGFYPEYDGRYFYELNLSANEEQGQK